MLLLPAAWAETACVSLYIMHPCAIMHVVKCLPLFFLQFCKGPIRSGQMECVRIQVLIFLQHIHCSEHRLRPIPDEPVCSGIGGADDIARHGEHVPPCSSAQRAVIREPLFSPASITTVPQLTPESSRFRTGKVVRPGGVPGGNSLTTAPCAAIDSRRYWFSIK